VDKEQIEKQETQRAKIFDACMHVAASRAPFNTPAPRIDDPAHFRVVTCWYTDIFDPGIPPKWLAELLEHIRECSNDGKPWQFLLRTCQPQYLPEIDWPDNVEICITIMRQSQVADAEAAIKKLHARQPNLPLHILYDPCEEAISFSTLAGVSWLYIGALPGAPTRKDARRLTLDEFFALRVQAAFADCKITLSPHIHLQGIDEFTASFLDDNPVDVLLALHQRVNKWINSS
jgi:hypothetical protein